VKILITAGPTREPLDPVRYLSNRSTGIMGLALAREAMRRGHEALLVLGPVPETPPAGVHLVQVETALEMRQAVLDLLPQADAVLCAAAVADYRPVVMSEKKLKRAGRKTIELAENPDIAAEVGARRGKKPCVIFALETDEGEENARKKLVTKNADLCVLNAPAAQGALEAEFTLVRREGPPRPLGRITKTALAAAVFDELGL
jgi:phosphopantothenoylcysteine decarboxylase/phosphopantothenate--cysteine ligase